MYIALSKTERKVLRELTETGECNKILGHKLGVTQDTVKIHIARILLKLRVRNRTQAVLFAIKNPEVLGRP